MHKSRKWQTKGGLVRDDSDDELGSDDHPWHWIVEGDTNTVREDVERTSSKKRKASAMDGSTGKRIIVGACMAGFSVKIGDTVLLKSPEQGKDWAGLICAFSETDEDGAEEMCAHIQWFCTPDELSGRQKSRLRTDILPNESYITADFNMNPLTAINGKAIVLSKDAFFKKYPKGQPPKSKSGASRYAKTILCRRGVNQRTLRYTDDFVWEDRYTGPESLLDLIDWIKDQTKNRKKSSVSQPRNADVDYAPREEPADVPTRLSPAPVTPRKRRKTTSVAGTPKSSTKSTKFITPTHKRIVIKKPLEITPLGTRVLSPTVFLSSPYGQARSSLHVSAVPLSLPCRSQEFSTVYSHLHSAITDGTGACIYISGTPGTGKTATVREVVAALHNAVLSEELDDFHFVEINGMKVTDPHQSYSLLWEALKGDRVSPSHALTLLEHEFSHPSPRRVPCVVLMDELDQLVTKNQSVMYNFFNWPSLRHSRLIVLAVANTMDLPERTLSNKISSRLGLTRITFPGYTHTQLMQIISSRLENVPGDIVDADAVQFAARKVAAVSGDARRALDICRRAVEIAQQQHQQVQDGEDGHLKTPSGGPEQDDTDEPRSPHPSGVNTPTETNRNKGQQSQQSKCATSDKLLPCSTFPASGQDQTGSGRVTIATIKRAIHEATSSPVTQHVKSLPLASKLVLAGILARSRRTGGAGESTFADVLAECGRIADLQRENLPPLADVLLNWKLFQGCGAAALGRPGHRTGGASNEKGRLAEVPRVVGLGVAIRQLVEAGVVAMEGASIGSGTGAGGAARISVLGAASPFTGGGGSAIGGVGKGDRAAKIRLRVGEEEVRDALRGDPEVRGMGFDG